MLTGYDIYHNLVDRFADTLDKELNLAFDNRLDDHIFHIFTNLDGEIYEIAGQITTIIHQEASDELMRLE